MSTPSPFTVTKDGGHFEVKVDAHYVSDDEVETVRRYIATLKAENAKLRELVRIAIEYCDSGTCDGCPIQRESGSCPYSDMARELGVEP